MRRIATLWIALCLLASAGCSYDDLFTSFGEHYTDGYDQTERYHHYQSELSRWENYQPDSPAFTDW